MKLKKRRGAYGAVVPGGFADLVFVYLCLGLSLALDTHLCVYPFVGL